MPFLVLTLVTLAGAQARADQQVPVGPSPWLDVRLSSGTLTVKTWDRPTVGIASQGPIDVRHVDASQADSSLPRQYTVWSQSVPTDRGNVNLPEESFVLPHLNGSAHDAVVARGNGDTTVMIPRGTALVTAGVATGDLHLSDYHGAFVAQARDGGISLDRVNGTGYVEALRGPVTASNSSFERLRVRTATGNMVFHNCVSHQIEATSSYGSIVYDNGKFKPGMAHFESVHGNVALGVRGGAQIGARSGERTVHATVSGGGPTVTAVSKHGAVFLYHRNAAPAVAAPRQYQPQPRQYQPQPRQYQPQPRQYQPQPRQYQPQPRQYQPQPRQYQPQPRPYQPQRQQGPSGNDRGGRGKPPR